MGKSSTGRMLHLAASALGGGWLACSLGACGTATDASVPDELVGPPGSLEAGASDGGGGSQDASTDGSRGSPVPDASLDPRTDAASPGDGGADGQAPTDGGSHGPEGGGAADTDGDGVADGVEADDGDAFTDPNVFNGVRVETRGQSDNDPTCAMFDTLGEVRDALSGSPDEALDQYAGWDFDDASDERTDPAYGFLPPWTDDEEAWQIDAVGYIRLEEGQHCFEVAGETDESCASLFLVTTPAGDFGGWEGQGDDVMALATHDSAAACVQLAAGVYPIRWHYEMDNNRSGAQAFHLRYCHGASESCTPSEPLSARKLRVSP